MNFFSGHLDFFNAIFRVGVCWSHKTYICPYKKDLKIAIVPLAGGAVKALAEYPAKFFLTCSLSYSFDDAAFANDKS